MELTRTVLQRFVGGQIEIESARRNDIICGEICTIGIEDEGDHATLVVDPAWMAEDQNYPRSPSQWVPTDSRRYEANLSYYDATDIGQGKIRLSSTVVGETIILHPPGKPTLDRSKVQGPWPA